MRKTDRRGRSSCALTVHNVAIRGLCCALNTESGRAGAFRTGALSGGLRFGGKTLREFHARADPAIESAAVGDGTTLDVHPTSHGTTREVERTHAGSRERILVGLRPDPHDEVIVQVIRPRLLVHPL